jgi:hypothetical protein
MMTENEYFENIEFKRVEALMETESLTREEYELVKAWFPDFASEYLFHNDWNDTFLNLNIYSEVKHHEHQYRMEIGY